MRILYVSSKKHWGGVSSWMVRTARGLERRGHSVWLLAHPKGRLAQTAPQGCRIVSRRLGMDYHPLSVAFVCRLIKREGIELLLTNIEKEVMIGGIAARCCGIPNLRRVGREDDFNPRFRVKWHHRLLVDHAVTPCDYIQKRAKRRAPWLDLSHFSTIYNGRNPVRYSEAAVSARRRRWGLSADHVIIGLTSQLSPIKGIDDVLRVFARLVRRHPQCRLVVCGEGGHMKALKALAQSLAIQQRVVFAGFTTDPLLSAAAYDIAVSNSRFEGFPNTVVEYFAAGRPVVTTDAGGVTEMARQAKNALVIPVADAKALHNSLRMLIQTPALRRRLAAAARRTIEDGFSEDAMLDRLEALFGRLITKADARCHASKGPVDG